LVTQGDSGRVPTERAVSTIDDLRRLTAQSRVRLLAVEDLREQHRLITRSSLRRLDESRLLVQRHQPSAEV
jgi:hypothetical protein